MWSRCSCADVQSLGARGRGRTHLLEHVLVLRVIIVGLVLELLRLGWSNLVGDVPLGRNEKQLGAIVVEESRRLDEPEFGTEEILQLLRVLCAASTPQRGKKS